MPIIKVEKDKRPVVKVYDENDELIFAIRTNGDDFTPKVRNAGKYKVIVGYPESNDWKEYEVTDKSPEAIDSPY
nr:hypothetical protein [Cytophagales bacterium]